VAENILLVLEMLGVPKGQRMEKLNSLLDELNIGHLKNQVGQSLSGGERRRVEIARTLAANPSFVLLDEPFTGVDPIAVHDIQDLVVGLKNRNIGVLITDHNVRETLSITDRAYIIYSGKILTSGVSAQLVNDPIARERYLGERFEL
jgi:lipopolysaccharide export system ATP-binding protein